MISMLVRWRILIGIVLSSDSGRNREVLYSGKWRWLTCAGGIIVEVDKVYELRYLGAGWSWRGERWKGFGTANYILFSWGPI
jgi:hypothetical protein